MGVIRGLPPVESAPAQLSAALDDGKFKILGYTLQEWNEVMANIKSLVELRKNMAPQAQIIEVNRSMDDNNIPRRSAAPAAPAAPAPCRCEKLLKQLAAGVEWLDKNGGSDALLSEILAKSNMTVGQLNATIKKALSE